MPQCDECRRYYAAPIYYSLGLDEPCPACKEDYCECTGNLCPDCAGPYLDPDNPQDTRRPQE